jgi:hypothetical protein
LVEDNMSAALMALDHDEEVQTGHMVDTFVVVNLLQTPWKCWQGGER